MTTDGFFAQTNPAMKTNLFYFVCIPVRIIMAIALFVLADYISSAAYARTILVVFGAIVIGTLYRHATAPDVWWDRMLFVAVGLVNIGVAVNVLWLDGSPVKLNTVVLSTLLVHIVHGVLVKP